MGERLKTSRYGEVRRFTLGLYVIYYRPVPGGADILRVIHGARDQSRLL